jgi:hypothetical protein
MAAKLPGQKSPVGHLLSFKAYSKISPGRAGERQVYGDEPAQLVGLTRP